MNENEQQQIISTILKCNSADDIKDILFLEEMLMKRRRQLEEKFHVKTKASSSGWFRVV